MNLLDKLMQENRLSQVELSKITGIYQSRISNFIHGRAWPNEQESEALLKFFNYEYSLAILLGKEEEEETSMDNQTFLPKDFKRLRVQMILLRLEELTGNQRLQELGIETLPDLLSKMGMALPKQADLVLGYDHLRHGHRETLDNLLDLFSATRKELEKAKKELEIDIKAVLDYPLENLRQAQNRSLQLSMLETKLKKAEKQLNELPPRNGTTGHVFEYPSVEDFALMGLVQKKENHIGGGYDYELTPKGARLFKMITEKRASLTQRLLKHEQVTSADVQNLWEQVKGLMSDR